MLTSLRTFRLTAALMVVLLLLSGSLPLVQHVCAMAQRQRPAQDHPCPRHTHDEAAAHQAHGSMHAHGAMHAAPQAEPPCEHAAPRQAVPADCCTVEAAPGITAHGVRLLKRALTPIAPLAVAAPLTASLQRDLGFSYALFFDTGPPPAASVSPHLIYSVLLN